MAESKKLVRVIDARTGFQILPPGTQLPGGWIIDGLLGAGGFGSVYIARGPQELCGPEGVCALKEFRLHPGLPPEAIAERVEMEAEVIHAFSGHPCLPDFVARFDVGKTHFLAEELIPGQSLARILQSGAAAFSLGETLAWLCVLTRTLDHLHRRLLLYQDLKPANIIITPHRTPVLVDFGAARHYAGVRANPRMLFGSLGYIAPEIITDPALQRDYRSDVYSLGCLAYTLLSGRILGRDQILGQRGITLPSKAMRVFRPECGNLPASWLSQIDDLLVTALEPDPADRLADLKWFYKRFQGLLLGAGDTEQVDALLRLVNERLGEQDRAIDADENLQPEGDPANLRHDPAELIFAPVDVHQEVVTLPVSVWSASGRPIRASVECTGTGVEVVETHFRAVEGRIRVRVFPRKVRGLNHWTRCTLILRLHTHRQLRIPILIFVASADSPCMRGEALPPIPPLDAAAGDLASPDGTQAFRLDGAVEAPTWPKPFESGHTVPNSSSPATGPVSEEPSIMDYENPHRRDGQTESTMFVAAMVQVQLVEEVSGAVHAVSGNVTTLGRGESNKITIADRSVSREHCRIERTAGGYTVVDRGSTNGTFVNGHRVTRTTLHQGDSLKVGGVVMRFEEGTE